MGNNPLLTAAGTNRVYMGMMKRVEPFGKLNRVSHCREFPGTPQFAEQRKTF
jgi:hypothetical protein